MTDSSLADSLVLVEAFVEKVRATGLEPTSTAAAQELVEAVEHAGRQLDALRLSVQDGVDRSKVWAADGHTSAKVFVEHVANLSGGEATSRHKAVKALRRLPHFAQAFADGEIGRCQVNRIARAYANPRTRQMLIENEKAFLAQAKVRKYGWFDTHMTEWTRLADEDGAEPAAERANRNRDFRLDKDYDDNWTINGGLGTLTGAELSDILDHFIEAEWKRDWDEARALKGDTACEADLPRTPAQRRADALITMAKQSVATPPGANRPETTTDIIIDDETFNRELAKLAGEPVEPETPGRPNFVCQTLTGHRISPQEAVLNALHHHIRRVVIGSDNVVINQGRRQRLFTGNTRLAALFSNNTCFHPSCRRHGRALQIDHTNPWAQGGETNQINGGGACGFHNRWKQNGYTVHRDKNGDWHTYRPDGTEIL